MRIAFFRINNIKQIEIIDSELISKIFEKIDEIVGESDVPVHMKRMEDCLIFSSDSLAIPFLKTIFRIGLLLASEEELFGFKAVVTETSGETLDAERERICNRVGKLEEDNRFYLCEAFYNEFLKKGSHGDFFEGLVTTDGERFIVLNVEKAINVPIEENTENKEGVTVDIELKSLVREEDVEKILDGISPRLNNPENDQIVYVFGYRGVGKTTTLVKALGKILGERRKDSFLYFSAMLKGSSPLHPFLKGIKEDYLDGITRYLNSIEEKIWEDKSILLTIPYEHTVDIVPDRFLEDYMTVFNLYILAFIRRMQDDNLPAFVVFDDIELYHPLTRRHIRTIIRDFLCYDSFIPLLVSSDKELLGDFEEFNIKKIYIHPLSWKFIERVAEEMDVKEKLSEKRLKRIRRMTGGRIPQTVMCLDYIGKSNDVDINRREKCFRYLVENLDEDSVTVLYLLENSKVLLNYDSQISYLRRLGYENKQLEKIIILLRRGLLLSVGESAGLSVAGIRKYLEERLAERTRPLLEDFSRYMIELYENGEYSNYILLFYYLSKTRKTETVRELFRKIIERKLRERDFTGCEVFLQEKFIKLLKWETRKEKAIRELFKLKLAFLRNDFKSAETHLEQLEERKNDLEERDIAEFNLIRSFLKISAGRPEEALKCGKEALFYAEETGNPCNEARAHESLGLNMLARGRLDDAMDYFSMAGNVSSGYCHLTKLEALAFHSVTNFLQGDLALSFTYVERGMKEADNSFSREWGLFLRFLKGRIYFELGEYGEAARMFEVSLAFDSIYRMKGARHVLYAWLSRCFTYMRNPVTAMMILEPLEESPLKKIFLSEVYLFAIQYEKAYDSLELFEEYLYSDFEKKRKVYIPGLRVYWGDGFESVEGKTYELAERCKIYYAASLRAYTGFLLGHRDRSLSLHGELIRNRKHPSFNPYLHILYFLYSESLASHGQSEVSDKFTILNRAWKMLQERSNRIGDAKMRRKYMENNYWNNRLYEAALTNRLI